jgi:hypothetical protein
MVETGNERQVTCYKSDRLEEIEKPVCFRSEREMFTRSILYIHVVIPVLRTTAQAPQKRSPQPASENHTVGKMGSSPEYDYLFKVHSENIRVFNLSKTPGGFATELCLTRSFDASSFC